MKKIYQSGAVSIMPCGRGIIFTAVQSDDEVGRSLVSFRQYSFDTGAISLVTKNVYMLNKFGNRFEEFAGALPDYFNCRTAHLPDSRLFAAHPEGWAIIFSHTGELIWEGSIKYKGFGPAEIAVDGDNVWCSYPESNAIIKYNSRSMRQEFRVGGSASGGISAPLGLFCHDGVLTVTSLDSGAITNLYLDSFRIEKIYEFTEPVLQYAKVDSNEVILAKSGIYKI